MRVIPVDHRVWLVLLPAVISAAAACGDDPASPDPVVDQAPVVEPDIQYDTVFAGDLLQLTVEASDDHGLRSIRAKWRDGTPNSEVLTSGQSVTRDFSHTYVVPGMYSVEFSAFDTGGQHGIGLAIVWVEQPDQFPVVEVTAPDTVLVGQMLRLEFDASDDRALDRVIVRFGDGSPAREFVAGQSQVNCPPTCAGGMSASVGHTYGYAGSFGVSVQALDTAGQSVTVWRSITSVDAP